MSSSRYALLEYDSLEAEDEKGLLNQVPLKRQSTSLSRLALGALITTLFLSLCVNIVLLFTKLHNQTQSDSEGRSPFGADSPLAGLPKDLSTPYSNRSVYLSPNKTAQDDAWREIDENGHEGVIVLSQTEAQSRGLLPAQLWPWDHSKGIYILNGYHQLHCVQMVYQTLQELWNNQRPTYTEHHVTHCLDNLREEAVCQADDTPRYSGRLNDQADNPYPVSGIGQNRKCRDWNKLRAWALEHTACYKREYGTDENAPLVNRYKHCPDGRVLWSVD